MSAYADKSGQEKFKGFFELSFTTQITSIGSPPPLMGLPPRIICGLLQDIGPLCLTGSPYKQSDNFLPNDVFVVKR